MNRAEAGDRERGYRAHRCLRPERLQPSGRCLYGHCVRRPERHHHGDRVVNANANADADEWTGRRARIRGAGV